MGIIKESATVDQYILVKQREILRLGGENIKIQKKNLRRFQTLTMSLWSFILLVLILS